MDVNTVLLVLILAALVVGAFYWLHTAKGAAELALVHSRFDTLHTRLDSVLADVRSHVQQLLNRGTSTVVVAPAPTGAPAAVDYDAAWRAGTPIKGDPKMPADTDTSDAAYAYWVSPFGPRNGAPAWVVSKFQASH